MIDYPLYEARRQTSMTVNDAMKRRLANMALLITGMIWGSGFVVMKNTLDSMSTNYILAIRFTIAALGLSYTLFTKGPVTFEKIKAGANLGLYIYGAFAVQTYGLMFTTAGPAFFARGTKSGSMGAAEAEEARNTKPVTASAVFLRMPFIRTPCAIVFRAFFLK